MASHYPGTQAETRALDAYVKLARAAAAVEEAINAHLSEVDLTTSQFGVLEALLHLGPLPQGVLAGKILTSPANLSHVLAQLEERGWLRRERDEDDRRIVRAVLTPAGEAFIADLMPRHVQRVVQAFSCLDAPDQTELARLLRTLGRAQVDAPPGTDPPALAPTEEAS